MSYQPRRRRSARAVERSDNGKTGPVSATYVSQSSCPKSCPLKGDGCYAEYGHTGIHTARLNAGEADSPEEIAREEADEIDRLSGRHDLRLHVVGDSRTNRAARIVAAAARRFVARASRMGRRARVWTYTHAWRTVDRDSWGDVSVLASCDRPEDVELAAERGYASALIVREFESEKAYTREDGLKIVPCPHQTERKLQCVDCGVCMAADMLLATGHAVGFLPHGSGKKRVLERISLEMAEESA